MILNRDLIAAMDMVGEKFAIIIKCYYFLCG
jgi:hypothetical protein